MSACSVALHLRPCAIKHMKSSFDFGFVAEYVEDYPGSALGSVIVHLWDDDGDSFSFIRVMLCPEIGVMFAIDMYGYCYGVVEEDDAEFHEDSWVSRCMSVGVVPALFPDTKYIYKAFSPASFKHATKMFRKDLVLGAYSLGIDDGVLGHDILQNVVSCATPEWLKLGMKWYDIPLIDYKADMKFDPYTPNGFEMSCQMFDHITDMGVVVRVDIVEKV